MNTLAGLLLAYLLNSLWQIPLVLVTAWLAARAGRRLGPAIEHRIWVSALALEVLLPACSPAAFGFFEGAWHSLLRNFGANAPASGARITAVAGVGSAHGVLRLHPALLNALLVAYGCSVLYFALRLAWGLGQTGSLRRRAQPVLLADRAALTWQRCCDTFCLHTAQLVVSADLSGPVTIGVRRYLLLLPAGWPARLAEEDLEAAIAHEFAHMHRRDFAKNLLYEVLSLPIAFNPLLWLTRSQIAGTREILCDKLAAEALSGKQKYAGSLLRLAAMLSYRSQTSTLQAIGIFDANNFERRVMNLTQNHIEVRGIRRSAVLAICVALGLGTCVSAVALHMNVSKTPQTEAQSAQANSAARVSSGVMAENILTKVEPIYPQEARDAKITGAVVLRALIGKDGRVEQLVAISGPKELQGASLDAVRQWVYKPYLLNGAPTEVQTTVTVTFTLEP